MEDYMMDFVASGIWAHNQGLIKKEPQKHWHVITSLWGGGRSFKRWWFFGCKIVYIGCREGVKRIQKSGGLSFTSQISKWNQQIAQVKDRP